LNGLDEGFGGRGGLEASGVFLKLQAKAGDSRKQAKRPGMSWGGEVKERKKEVRRF